MFSPVHRRDRKLQNRCQRNPDKVRHLSTSNPFEVRPDGNNAPDDCGPDNQNVDRSQRQISHPKLNRCENQVRREIDGEGQCHQPADPTTKHLHEHKPKTDKDDRIKNLPDQPNRRRGWRPGWFGQRIVPFDPGHEFNNLVGPAASVEIAADTAAFRNALLNMRLQRRADVNPK